MAVGRRCPMGCETWPDEALFLRCPQCGESTRRTRGVAPLDLDEAVSILSHIEFEAYYKRYCAKLNQPAEGALPCV